MVLLGWLRKNWLRVAVHAGSLLPLAWLAWRFTHGVFLVDPVREIESSTGKTALILLALSLACTPINTLTGYAGVIRVRRALGLYSFLYTSVHFLIFAGLDYGFDLGLLAEAIFDQRYVIAGAAAGLLLLPLAITSTRGWQKRLKKNWKRLHRLVYLAAVLAIVHFVWLSKDWREPLRYGLVVTVLLALRLPWVRTFLSQTRRRVRTAVFKGQGPGDAAASRRVAAGRNLEKLGSFDKRGKV